MAYIRDYQVTEVTTASTNPQAQVLWPTHATNDILIMMMANDGTAIAALPSGYTDIQNQAGVAQSFRLCYKVAASSSEVCPALSLATTNEWHIIVFAIAGADYADPINTSVKRSTTDAAAPFFGANSGASIFLDEDNVLVLSFCNSDSGLALTATNDLYTNLVNGDCGTAGAGCAYTFQPTSGLVNDAIWTGRLNDDTTACMVAINDDGNGTRPAYLDPLSSGTYISALGGTSLIGGDTNRTSMLFPFISMRDPSQVWSYDGTSTYTDETADAISQAVVDVTITNAVGACLYIGYDYTFNHMCISIPTAQVAGTYVWEYYNGSTWATLTVAGVLTAVGAVRFTWTTPASMSATTVNSVSATYIRLRVTGIFTTTPILSQIGIGGWLTTYDAAANVADAGVNPYMDVLSLTPAATSNFSGTERVFGTAKGMSAGLLVLHHKAALARDYAVDPAVNDVTYPVTTIGGSGISGTVSGYGGFIVVLYDGASRYKAYSIHSKGALSSDNTAYNTAVIGLSNGAEAYGINDSLALGGIAGIGFLPQGRFGALSAYVSSLAMIELIVFAGGDSTNPANLLALKNVANRVFGTNNLLTGSGDFVKVYAPLQFGGGGRIMTLVDGAIFQFPYKFDGKKYLDWNAADNVAGVIFYGQSSSDQLKFPNCTWKGAQPFRWEFHSSHSGSTVMDFTGSTVDGATVTLQSTLILTDIVFKNCPTFTLNAAILGSCTFTNTTVDAASPIDAAGVTDSTFVKTSGTRHGITITGTAADMTLSAVIFNGFASTNGSTGNEAIYVNIASGSMTINIDSGGNVPSIRTAGAVVTVKVPVTVKVTAKDADTLAAVASARVLLRASSGTTVTITRAGSTASVSHTAHGYSNGQKVSIVGANQGEYCGVFTVSNVTTNAYDYTVTGTPITPATGTITSYKVILDGDTNGSGIVQDTGFNFGSNLAVTGRIRKASSAPYYKTASVSGTITSIGLDLTVLLIGDN